MRIEIAYALPDRQILLEWEVESGATVEASIRAACDAGKLPGEVMNLQAGIWGQVVPPGRIVKDGDRVELYRPLRMDPREARRQYAEAGSTMSSAADRPNPSGAES